MSRNKLLRLANALSAHKQGFVDASGSKDAHHLGMADFRCNINLHGVYESIEATDACMIALNIASHLQMCEPHRHTGTLEH
jgi:hypothetical protein